MSEEATTDKRKNETKVDSFTEKDVRGDASSADTPVYGKEQVAFLIDASKGVQTTLYSGNQRRYKNLTLFQVALKQVHDIVLSRLAFSVEDDITIIFFNTPSDDGQNQLGGIKTWHSASPPSIELLDRLSSFNYDISRKSSSGSSANSFLNALIAAVLEFSDAKTTWDHAQTKIVVWTLASDGAYCVSENTLVSGQITQIIERRKFMLRIVTLDQTLNRVSPRTLRSSMWAAFVRAAGVYDMMYTDMCNHVQREHVGLGDLGSSIVPCDDGFHLNILKGKLKHNSISLDWCMGDFGTMPMKCFCVTSPAWPKCVGPTTWLDARDSSLLINKISEDVPVDIASMLSMPEEELPYYPKPVGKKQMAVPRISIPKGDVLHLRFPLPKGIFLIGFKPSGWIQESWQLRESYFMRPDENAPTTVYQNCTAIYNALVKRSVVAVCGFVKSDQSEPRLAAVLPFPASRPMDETDCREEFNGFAVIELPFADDIRHPEGKEEVFGKPVSITQSGIELAQEVIRSYQAHPNEHPGVAENPHIKRHFSLLEALLLDRPDVVSESTDSESGILAHTLQAFADHHGL
ncbi:hypothetical protein M9434_004926 [Picochlorum sp. BPE23]|nr:hypothetical protein M9434_004926 [Picochlorum sp. BPE23]